MEPIAEPNVWTGNDFADGESWVHELSPAMIEEIAAAMRQALAEGRGPGDFAPESFPLPATEALLGAAYGEIENGRGFSVLRGWSVDDYSYEENVAAFCGIGAHIGEAVVQNYEGENIVDVTDRGVEYSHRSRGYMSNKLLPFHSDGADLVGLLCLGVAAEGGSNLLASATKLYNTVLEEKPEYIETLTRGFYHHRRGQHDPGEDPLSPEPIPVFAFYGGYLHCCYNRNPIDWVEKEGMKLSDHEIEVLDYFDNLLQRPGMALPMKFRKGDIQFVNNFVLLHSRTEYRDDAAKKRHLVRLWLEDPKSKRNGKGLLDLYVPGSSRFDAAQQTG
jgi:alpha-ketoglutarate-dependent taurine dioxygenase